MDLINYVHDIYAVGRVEIYLVQPNEMSQVREIPEEDHENVDPEHQAHTSNPQDSKATPLEENDNENNEDGKSAAVLAHNDNDDDDGKNVQEEVGGNEGLTQGRNQSNMKWKHKMAMNESKRNEDKPLASYDVSLFSPVNNINVMVS